MDGLYKKSVLKKQRNDCILLKRTERWIIGVQALSVFLIAGANHISKVPTVRENLKKYSFWHFAKKTKYQNGTLLSKKVLFLFVTPLFINHFLTSFLFFLLVDGAKIVLCCFRFIVFN